MGKMLAFLAILGTLKLFRHYYLHLIEEVLSFDLMEYSGGSRISPRRGRQLSRGVPTYDFPKFSQKLHEIERIWTRGGHTSKFLLCRSATGIYVSLQLHVQNVVSAQPCVGKL